MYVDGLRREQLFAERDESEQEFEPDRRLPSPRQVQSQPNVFWMQGPPK